MSKPGNQGSQLTPMQELRRKLWFVLGALIVFRIGTYIPVPGVNASVLAQTFAENTGSALNFWNTFSGGALQRASIFALGITPYISASIVVQLLTTFVPSLTELKKEGEMGRRKISKITRYFTLVLAAVQSVVISTALPSYAPGLVPVHDFSFVVAASVSLTVGSLFLMWLGEQITERGIGNGISLIVFAGIVSGLPGAIMGTLEQARTEAISLLTLFAIAAITLIIIYAVVFVERSQRRIVIQYAQRNQMIGGRYQQSAPSYIPFKVNMAGVIPAIFASSIIAFITTFVTGLGAKFDTMATIGNMLYPGQPLQMVLLAALIIFFAFFYTALQYNPKDTAEQLKKSGAFIPGNRPGEQTAKLLDRIMTRVTMLGGLYLAIVALSPEFMRFFYSYNASFGGTSILIVVVVVMDFVGQVQSQMMSNKFGKILKESNLDKYRSNWR